jgi:intergrase/recombinase
MAMAPKSSKGTKKALAPCCERIIDDILKQAADDMEKEIKKISKRYDEEINRLYNKLREERDYSLQHEGTIKSLCKFICK